MFQHQSQFQGLRKYTGSGASEVPAFGLMSYSSCLRILIFEQEALRFHYALGAVNEGSPHASNPFTRRQQLQIQ